MSLDVKRSAPRSHVTTRLPKVFLYHRIACKQTDLLTERVPSHIDTSGKVECHVKLTVYRLPYAPNRNTTTGFEAIVVGIS